ncbi:MAG: GxxExxY protein [Desulfuromonadaceae bacterium]
MARSRENELAGIVVDASLQIHRILGPGLLESAYEAILVHELQKRGLSVAVQVPVPVIYESVRLDVGFRADIIVEDSVIVELKSLEKIAPVHKKQLTTYLKLSGKRLGLLINIGEELIKDGITRIVNGMPD